MIRVTFLHPDLGIGGAERLVVDAALALRKRGHDVRFVTTHHDPEHCFTETKDGTIPVEVVGDWLPKNIFGRFYALCAYFRMVFAALYIILFSQSLPTIVFCDLISVCIPILKLRVPFVVYYCHYPDQLLSQPGSSLKSMYRSPLDFLEEYTTGKADKVFVNSVFTQGIFYKTFQNLRDTPTEVLYPSINTEFFEKTRVVGLERILDQPLPQDACIILSINRYERKKNLELGIRAFAHLKTQHPELYGNSYLIIAGGYDKRVEENVEYHLELIGLADELGVADHIFFLRSLSDIDKASVLKHCSIVIYTPANEHFGIVPLEAMYNRKPVLAHNSGGPRETVLDEVSGYLASSEDEFAHKLVPLVKNKALRDSLGEAGRHCFEEKFSFAAFGEQLNSSLNSLLEKKDS